MSSQVLARLLRETPVMVTGYGTVSAAGLSVADLWQRLEQGTSPAVAREFDFGVAPRSVAVCAAPAFDLHDPDLRPVRRMDRSAHLAWLAAQQALRGAGLDRGRDGLSMGIVVGSSRGPLGKIAEGFGRLKQRRYPPSLSADCTFAALSGAMAQNLGATGPCATVSATCASGAYAIAFAAEQLLLGKADIFLVGATEAPLVPTVLAQLDAAGVLGWHPEPAQTCRPFDRTRNGLCLGEGSGFLVLETPRTTAQRKAVPLARLSGWGLCVDASGRAGVNETGGGLIDAATQALRMAGLEATGIDYLNTHGTGTRLNDVVEARALRRLFGAHADSLPCTSTKPITGHCLGATPALEAVIAIEAMRRGLVPPTANCRQPDPDCAINMQPDGVRPADLRHVMSNSLGFWGYHASLVFSRVT